MLFIAGFLHILLEQTSNHSCLKGAGKDGESRNRKDLDHSRVMKDEEAVCSVISTIQSMSNPFDAADDDGIVNIASGVVAPPEVQSPLLDAEEIG